MALCSTRGKKLDWQFTLLLLTLSCFSSAALLLKEEPPSGGAEHRVRCPPFRNPNLTALQEQRHHGPVLASKHGKAGSPLHLFLLSLPNAGSTALASLIGTSPQATLLCSAASQSPHSWPEHCEGTWELIREGVIHSLERRWEPEEPSDWAAALRVYERFWNLSRSVRVDKSPPNVAKVNQIVKYFTQSRKAAAFIVLTHASCSPGHQGSPQHQNAEMIVHAAKSTGGFPVLMVPYEDLLRDPYDVARRILEFMPALEELDPSVPGLPQEGPDGGRELSVVDYVLEKAPFQGKEWTTGAKWKVDQALGYVG